MPELHVDWRVVGSRHCAWFGAESHGHAASLVGALADGGVLPALEVRGDGVRVRVGTADEALTHAISDAARGLGLVADPGVLQELRLRVESRAPATVLPFWRAALDYDDVGADALADRWRRCPVLRFAESGEVRPLRNRLHLDSGHPGPVGEVVVALKGEGGQERFACEWYSTMADADGNEVDVVPGGPLDESAADWGALFGGMACYPGASPSQAAEVAVAAGRLADDAGLPLMIDVRPDGVVFDSGKDQWEVAGFVALAAAVQGAARAAGLTADNSRLRFVQAGIDAVDVPTVREFWRVALGYVPAPNPGITDLFDPRQLNPVIFVQPMDATEVDRRRQRDRITIELLLPADQLRARMDTAVAAGGRILEDGAPDRCRIADPEGNELLLLAG